MRISQSRACARRSPLKGCLQPPTPFLVHWGGRSEVKTLRNEPISLALPLTGVMLYSGLYVNELLTRLLKYETNFSALFFDYLHCLQQLVAINSSPEPALRSFELSLLGLSWLRR